MIRGVLMLAAARTNSDRPVVCQSPIPALERWPDRAVEGARVESAVGGVRRVACTASAAASRSLAEKKIAVRSNARRPRADSRKKSLTLSICCLSAPAIASIRAVSDTALLAWAMAESAFPARPLR
jgi:hypothetical protein